MRSAKVLSAALALTLWGGGVSAQVTAPDAAFDRFLLNVTGVGQQTIAVTGSGQLVSSQSAPTLSTNGGPDLAVSRSGQFANGAGSPVTVSGTGRFPKAALSSLLVRGVKLLPVVATGVALVDLFGELGYSVQGTPGAVVVGAATNANLYNATCLTGQANKKATIAQHLNDCRTQQKAFETANGFPNCNVVSYTTGSGPNYPIRVTKTGSCGNPGDFMITTATLWQTNPSGFEPVSDQTLIDAIAARSGWPSSSKLAQATLDSLSLTGEKGRIENITASGPSTSPGTTSTTTNPDGSTTTTTTGYSHTYDGPRINTTTTTTVSTCTGAGACSTATTVETPKVDEQPFTMPCGIAGTPACVVDFDTSGIPPDDGGYLDEASGDIDPERQQLLGLFDTIDEFDLGEWSWTFSLPTGCTPLEMFLGVEVNPCAWQSTIHDLMSVIWILTGITGLFVIFSRAF